MEYRALFPEPVTWKGWWDDEDNSQLLEHGDFFVEAWQAERTTKIHTTMASARDFRWEKAGIMFVLGTSAF